MKGGRPQLLEPVHLQFQAPLALQNNLRCPIQPAWIVCTTMANSYKITLEDLDVAQLLDGLEVRAESWERTAEYLRTHEMPAGEFFVVEECSKPEEADAIANRYRSIITKIQGQILHQPPA